MSVDQTTLDIEDKYRLLKENIALKIISEQSISIEEIKEYFAKEDLYLDLEKQNNYKNNK